MQTLYLLTLPVALERFGDLFTTDTRRQAEAFGSRIVAHFAAVAEGSRRPSFTAIFGETTCCSAPRARTTSR